ncbi:MraZ-like protein [Pseudobythopirellula maris]|uniref:Transcriptional regulator MraZ n=1 Tax=Pseudobythopirellula maris TaxID=2527991 RepID=A0A5C5ZU92_9BACT|nr:division/cell wall cluster transcriptional repressor MraZ [Pseudobythopirellula maris]TWT90776.1 MraZ-like protein [Pseudobythopirellula maris]
MLTTELSRRLDERYRLTLPVELVTQLTGVGSPGGAPGATTGGLKIAGAASECLLAKERPGCVSLWERSAWQRKIDQGVGLVSAKLSAGKLDTRMADVQRFGRLLSTRYREVQLGDRGRLVIPDGFREFLGVEPGGTVMVVGAGVCLELWEPAHWAEYLGAEMPAFGELFDELAG